MPLLAMRKQFSVPAPISAPKPAAGLAVAVQMVEVTEEHDGQRLDNFLMRLCKGVPKSHIYKAVRGGEVRINKGRVAPDARIHAGDIDASDIAGL